MTSFSEAPFPFDDVSSIEEVIAKFAQLTPQERAKRWRAVPSLSIFYILSCI